jgi:hypothetical protein
MAGLTRGTVRWDNNRPTNTVNAWSRPTNPTPAEADATESPNEGAEKKGKGKKGKGKGQLLYHFG